MEKVADVAQGIVMVALVTTIVASPNTARQITALANGFANAIRAAMGKH